MPKVTIWVREEDWEVFDALPDRPKFIHNMLLVAKKQLEDLRQQTEPQYTDLEKTA